MNLWTPTGKLNQAELSAKARRKMGTFPLSECLDAPHHWEACQLDKRLKVHDDKLEVMGWYGHTGGFRWIISWTNREGAELLIRTIETDDEQYEPPNERWLEDIRKHDLWKESDWEKIKRHTEEERRQERYEAEMKKKEMEPVAENLRKMFHDAGNSQREDLDPLTVAIGGPSRRRGKRPGS